MSSTYIRYPATSSGSSIPTYANAAALPASADNGSLAVTLDTDSLYIFDGDTNTWKLIGGPGVVLSIGTIDSGTASANGAHIDGNALIMQSASATRPGLVNTTTQTMAGNKTFTGTISASNLSGTNTGDVTLTAVGAVPSANAASLSGQVLTLQPADGTHPGVVTSGTQTLGGAKTFSGAVVASTTLNVTGITTLSDRLLSSTTKGSTNWLQYNTNDGTFKGTASNSLELISENGINRLNSYVSGDFRIIHWGPTGSAYFEYMYFGAGTGIEMGINPAFSASGNTLVLRGISGGAGYIIYGSDESGNPKMTVDMTGKIMSNSLTASLFLQSDASKNIVSVSAATATAALNAMVGDSGSGGTKGLVPAPATGDATKYLRGDATWQTVATFSNPMTTLGDMISGGASGALTRLAGDTSNTRKFLRSVSTAGTATAPAWDVLASGDIPALIGNGSTPVYFVDSSDATKRFKFDASGLGAGNTLTFASAGGTNPTITFPNISATVIVNSGTQTLSSKLLATDTSATKFVNASDATKILQVLLAGATTGKTMSIASSQTLDRTVTLPDATDTLVGKATTDTLTNKTISAASNTITLATANFAAPTVQKFTSSSGTYTTSTSPRAPVYIRVRMVGGGGGGGGCGAAGSPGAGGTGGNSTFGSSLLVANGGVGGGLGNASGGSGGGAGGTASLGSGPIGTSLTGGSGGGSNNANPGAQSDGGGGGAATPFGGAGGGAAGVNNGSAAIANSGSGGGGGGSVAASFAGGGGGGAGGFVDAIISSPSATYAYAVGAAGAAGAAGTSGTAGGAGGSGYIEVTEYYQ